jgi:hypothetical protein
MPVGSLRIALLQRLAAASLPRGREFEIDEFRLPKSSGADTASPSAIVSNMPQMRQPAPQIGHFARLAGME